MSISENPYDDDRYEINYAEANPTEAADKTLKPTRDELANKAIEDVESGLPVRAMQHAAGAAELNDRLADPDPIYAEDPRVLFDDGGYVDLADDIISGHADDMERMETRASRIPIGDGRDTLRDTIDELRTRVNGGDNE